MAVAIGYPQVVPRENDDDLVLCSSIDMSKYNPDRGKTVRVLLVCSAMNICYLNFRG